MFILQFIYYLYINPSSMLSMFGASEGSKIIDWEAIGWNDPEKVEELENFGKLPMQIVGLVISTIALGSILNIASSRESPVSEYNNGFKISKISQVNPVVKITKYHAIIKGVLSAACLIAFMYKTGLIHNAGEYFYMNSQYRQTT